MLTKKAGLLLALLTLTSCTTKLPITFVRVPLAVVQDKNALRNAFEQNIGNKVYFAFDSAVLSQKAKDQLEKQADWLLAHQDATATIEGHCDEQGRKDYNLALGLLRATAAERFLVSKGIDKKRFTLVTYGKERPEVEGHNQAAWEMNRRAVTVIIKCK